MRKSLHGIGSGTAVCLICTACIAASPAAAYTPRGMRHAHPSRNVQPLAIATVQPTANGGDQADALQAAFDALQPGQHLVLAPGRYVVGRSLTVSKADVVISGYGATLVATDPAQQTIVMSGSGSTLVGVTLVGTGTTRLTTPESTKVEVTGTGVQVLGVTIQGGASAGIFVFGGSNVAIVGNTVQATLADGIHTTYGSTNVLVRGNTVKDTGDDLIAVVSYQHDGRLSANVLIDGNTVSGNYWGRGISVVGGRSVTISNNTVNGVQKAAGILVAQEDSWKTYGVSDVLIENNVVGAIQDGTNANNGLPPTGQGAIELDTWSGSVSYVVVKGNRVSGSGYAGFRAAGNVCHFAVTDTTFASIAGAPVSLLTNGCPAASIVAYGNSLGGVALVPPVGASPTGTIPAGGAVTAGMPAVRTSLMRANGTSAPARN
ncbi:right-handed parallel beta-helix repeat-containing protein [Burkholderia metallica]